MSTTGSCTDGGGTRWKTRVDWGPVYNGSEGQRHVTVDFAGWTTDAQRLRTDSIVTTYNPDNTLREALTRTATFDYNAGTSWNGRNPTNPIDGPGKTKNCRFGRPGWRRETKLCRAPCPARRAQPVIDASQFGSTATVTPASTPASSGPAATVTPASLRTLPLPCSTCHVTNGRVLTTRGQYTRADAAGWDDPTFFHRRLWQAITCGRLENARRQHLYGS